MISSFVDSLRFKLYLREILFYRFDCVFPTRTARFGVALVRGGSLRIRSKEYAEDRRSLDGHDVPDVCGISCSESGLQDACKCPTCNQYSRAYIHALFRDHNSEALAAQLVTCHNVAYMMALMRSMREVIYIYIHSFCLMYTFCRHLSCCGILITCDNFLFEYFYSVTYRLY